MEEDIIRTEATIQQKFHKISKRKENQKRCYSKEVPIGEKLWRFSIKKVSKFLAVYIHCENEKNLGITWSCYAFCKISIINMNSGDTFSRQFTSEFISQGVGYPELMSWDRLLNPVEGFNRNDSITIEVNVNTDPNTRMTLGHLGLRENGSNKLLNCLLQILFFTEPLRKAIFQIPVSSDTSEKCVVLELQRIFYELQFGTEPGDATKLIDSFDEKLKHHLYTENTSEFLRELLSILDSKTKGTCMEGTIPQLFQAKEVSSITCINDVRYKINEGVCHGIQVNIENNKNIHEALRLDIKSNESVGEKTSKDNSPKIAKENLKFQVLPPFLYFHLNRCHRRGGYRKKYHGLFEFNNKLCLDAHLQKPDTSDPANYTLHAVLVHSGSHIGGHYSLYIQGSGWYKLDCHPFSDCTKYEAIDANFGLQNVDTSPYFATLSSSACMLVYRRDSVPCPEISQKINESEIPSQLRDCLNAHSFITVNVLLENSFKDHQGNDLFDEQKTEYRVFKMKKDATIEYLIEEISNKLEQSPEKMRLWPFSVRSNQTLRPSFLDMENVCKKTVFDVVGNEKYWNIFLELPSEDSTTELQEFNKTTDVLLFFKMYDPKLKKIQYCGHSYLPDNTTVSELIQILNKKAGFPQETDLEVYEEIGPNNVEKIANHSEYLNKVLNELVHGSIIVFEKKEERKLSDFPTCVDYFRDLFYRIELSFIDKNIANDQGFKMKLSRKTTYDQLTWTVANKINADPYSLIFFEFQRDEATPVTHIKTDYEGTLEDVLDFSKSKIPYTLVYKKMESISKKVSQKKKFNFLYLSSKLKREKNFALYFEENDTLADFLETIKKYIQSTEDIEGPLRLMDSNCNKVSISPKHKTSKNNDIENIWRIEDADDEDELLICCIKFHAEIFSTFDTPFLVKIKQGEPFANVKERIRKKLSVSEKDWEKFKVAIMHMGEVNVIDYIINFSDFILPRHQSEIFDYYISIVEDLSNNVEESNDNKETSNCESCKLAVAQDELKCFQCCRIFHFHCAKDAMKCCREMDSFKSDALKIAREPHEDISMNIVPESESRISFLQENIHFLKKEISILKNELQKKD